MEKNKYMSMVAEGIRYLKASGLGYTEISNILGTSAESVGRWLRGEREPRLSHGLKILNMCGWWVDAAGELRKGEAAPVPASDHDETMLHLLRMMSYFLDNQASTAATDQTRRPIGAIRKQLRDVSLAILVKLTEVEDAVKDNGQTEVNAG